MSQKLVPARIPTLGKILSREIEARGWTQKDLAEIMGRPVQTINKLFREASKLHLKQLSNSPKAWVLLLSFGQTLKQSIKLI